MKPFAYTIYGVVSEIKESDVRLLINLGLGQYYHNQFYLLPFKNRNDLEYHLIPLADKEEVLCYLADFKVVKNIVLLNTEFMRKLKAELIARNVLTRRYNNYYFLATENGH